MEWVTRHSLVERMVGAAMLRPEVYEEVEADLAATGQAAIVVGIAAVAAAVGSLGRSSTAFLAGLISVYLGWLLWSAVTYVIGDKVLGGTATWGELLRTLGFAQAPAVLLVFMIIPFFGGFVSFAVAAWLLVAGIVALRQALDISTGKAILTAVLGWVAYAVLALILGAVPGVRPNM